MANRKRQETDLASRKHQRELFGRARHLSREAPKLLKKHRKRVPESAAVAITEASQELRELQKQRPAEGESWRRLSLVVERLDKLLDEHLGFARKSVLREYAESIGYAVLIALFIRTFLFEAFKIPTGSMIPTLLVNDHIFVNKLAYGIRVPFTQLRVVEWDQPSRGEVVVFEFPKPGEDYGKDFIKRVVAIPGDRVRLADNRLVINDEPVPTEVISRRVPCRDHPTLPCECTLQREQLGDHEFTTQHYADGTFCSTRANSPNWPHESPERGVDPYFGAADSNPSWPEVVIPERHVLVMGDNRDNSSDGRYWGLVPIEAIKGRAFITWWSNDRSRLFTQVR